MKMCLSPACAGTVRTGPWLASSAFSNSLPSEVRRRMHQPHRGTWAAQTNETGTQKPGGCEMGEDSADFVFNADATPETWSLKRHRVRVPGPPRWLAGGSRGVRGLHRGAHTLRASRTSAGGGTAPLGNWVTRGCSCVQNTICGAFLGKGPAFLSCDYVKCEFAPHPGLLLWECLK